MQRTPLIAAAAAAAALAAPPAAHGAEALYGVTQGNVLVSFQSDNTRDLDFQRPIRGLPVGENIIGLDVRPATGQLYGLGQQSRLYVINPRTGAARQVGEPITPALAGTTFGFDFNPTVDRLRITSDQEQNLRVNPDTGEAIVDGPLAYQPGDPGAGSDPSIGASAYSNSAPGATSTTLFDVDDARGVLATQNPANAGTLQTEGALGGSGSVFSFDIGDNNAAFAVRRAAEDEARLLSVDLTTGAAADASTRGVVATQQPLLSRGVVPSVACDEACTVDVTVQRGGTTVGRASGEVPRRAGRTSVAVPLSESARAAVRRTNTLFTVRVVTTDGAGNDPSRVRRVRSQSLAERRGEHRGAR